MTIDGKISQLIKILGISPSLKGYYAIREAVKLMMGDASKYICAITSKLYPDVAEKLSTTSSGVEREIRYAIVSGWVKGSAEIQCEIFGSGVLEKEYPTNAEFITTVADYIALQMEEENENTKDN